MNVQNDCQGQIPYKSFKQCLLITLSVAIGTFGSSYNIYLLNGPLEYIRIWLKINDSPQKDFLEGGLQSALNFGGLIGCVISFAIIKKGSRRYMIFLIDSLLITGALGLMIGNYYSFFFFRVIAGLGAGLTTLVTPMFLKEILPSQIYGVLGGQNLVFSSLGTIVQSISALGFKDVRGQTDVDITYWRFYLLPPIIMCLLRVFMMLFYFRHDSPIYTLQRRQRGECLKFIEFMYKPEFVANVEMDFVEAVTKRQQNKAIPRSRFTLGVLMNIFYANSGILPITTYSTVIFTQVASSKVSQILTIGMSVIKFILYSTGAHVTQRFGILLVNIEGRRKPLILGTIILSVLLLCSCVTSYINQQEYDGILKSISVYLLIVTIYLYFGVFFNTFGVIIPVYTPEVLTGAYLTIATMSQWIFNIAITFIFPVIVGKFGFQWTFLYFGIMMAVATIYFYVSVKETQNLTEAEINRLWSKKTDVLQSISEYDNLVQ